MWTPYTIIYYGLSVRQLHGYTRAELEKTVFDILLVVWSWASFRDIFGILGIVMMVMNKSYTIKDKIELMSKPAHCFFESHLLDVHESVSRTQEQYGFAIHN